MKASLSTTLNSPFILLFFDTEILQISKPPLSIQFLSDKIIQTFKLIIDHFSWILNPWQPFFCFFSVATSLLVFYVTAWHIPAVSEPAASTIHPRRLPALRLPKEYKWTGQNLSIFYHQTSEFGLHCFLVSPL